jgi:glycosyltransferase involved in cell wall biosynthesis
METVSVIIPTFGDREIWNRLAMRAVASVVDQSHPPDEIIRIHEETLCYARNKGGYAASSEWLCFLDADDELHPGYLKSMLKGQGDLRFPRVINQHIKDPKSLFTGKSLLEGNYLPIGTLVKRKLFLNVGGFPSYPAYEDWAFWLRCNALGAKDKCIWDAIYQAWTDPSGRNLSHLTGDLAIQIREDFIKWKDQYAPKI